MPSPASRPSASTWEWTQTVLLAANLGWTTLCLGGSLAEIASVTCAVTGALVVVHLLARASKPPAQQTRLHPAGWLLLPFLAYAAANVIWVTPVPWLGWRDWLGWAELVAVFWVVLNSVRSAATRRFLIVTLFVLGAAEVAMSSYQHFVRPDWMVLGRVLGGQFIGRATGSFGIPNSLAAFLILLMPALGALAIRRGANATARIFWGSLAALFAFAVVLTISRGAWIALGLALIVWPLAAGAGNWLRRLGLAMAMLVGLCATVWLLYTFSPKVHERLTYFVHDMGERTRPIMWRAAWGLFRESPTLGSGAGSYNVLFEKFRPEQFPDETKWAHNDYLNTLSDYGAVGFALFFGACSAIAWCSRRAALARRKEIAKDGVQSGRDWIDDPAFVLGLGIGMLAFALQLFVDFHFKIPALALAFATVAGLVISYAWPLHDGSGERRSPVMRLALGVSAGGLTFITIGFVQVLRVEGMRFYARESIDQLAIKPPDAAGYRARIFQARADLSQAVALDPRNGQAWADLSYAIALRSHFETGRDGDLGRQAEAAAVRALAISQVCNEFWIRRGVARDMQSRWLEGGSDFTQAIAIAPTNAVAWYYDADHLYRKPSSRGLAEAALDFCLRLDPGNPEGLALRQRLAISQKRP